MTTEWLSATAGRSLVLLSGADEEEAHDCAQQIYNGVQGLSLRYGLTEIGPVDVSIGIASYPQHAQSDNLLRAADVALYRAKELGRSRIVSFGMLEGARRHVAPLMLSPVHERVIAQSTTIPSALLRFSTYKVLSS